MENALIQISNDSERFNDFLAVLSNDTLTNKQRDLEPKTIESYKLTGEQFIKYLKENSLEFTFDSLKPFLSQFKTASTFNVKFAGIKMILLSFYKEPLQKAYIEVKMKEVKKPKTNKGLLDNKYIDHVDVKKLTTIDGNIRIMKDHGFTKEKFVQTSLIIQALFWTGCRISELLNIKIKNCKEINGIYNIDLEAKDTKTNTERTVYMSKCIFDEIREVFKGKVYLFETHKNTLFDRKNITRTIQKQAKILLNKNVTAHTLRHSKAMYLKKEKNMSPDEVARAIGHSSVITTMQYYFHHIPSAEEQGIY